MTSLKRVQFSTTIAAPADVVWEAMLGDQSYRLWTAPFTEGSYYEGTWEQGSRMLFLAPSGDGMVAEIAENRPQEFISVRHIGMRMNGVEDTESESVRAWAPAYENYSLVAVPEGTRVVVDQDVTADSEECLAELWPKALEVLQQLCENPPEGSNA
jgi:uncharacterized protein YndB with AHSA1/START domain